MATLPLDSHIVFKTPIFLFKFKNTPTSLLFWVSPLPGFDRLGLLEVFQGCYPFLRSFGRVWVFYYILFLSGALLARSSFWCVTSLSAADDPFNYPFYFSGARGGISLQVYTLWIGVICFLYPLCKCMTVIRPSIKKNGVGYLNSTGPHPMICINIIALPINSCKIIANPDLGIF